MASLVVGETLKILASELQPASGSSSSNTPSSSSRNLRGITKKGKANGRRVYGLASVEENMNEWEKDEVKIKNPSKTIAFLTLKYKCVLIVVLLIICVMQFIWMLVKEIPENEKLEKLLGRLINHTLS